MVPSAAEGQHHGGDQCLERHDTPGGERCEGAKPGRLPDFWRIGQFRAMRQRDDGFPVRIELGLRRGRQRAVSPPRTADRSGA